MKKSFSPSRSRAIQEIQTRHLEEERRIPISKAAEYNKYFCHYNNAVYMGAMSSYKKHGKGILLHDDGSAVITDYLHDTPSGHSVIFRQNSITSVYYKTNVQFQVAYKQGKYILAVPFSDSSYKAHGTGALIDYKNFKIYRLVFKKGVLVQKITHLDRKDNQDVFKRGITAKIIAVKHQQAFSLNFQKPGRVQIKLNGSKFTIGYFDEDGKKHGLSFTFYAENLQTNGEKSLYLKFIEKGYYRGSNLQTYGEKLFSNGNKYIGEFDKGQFHGQGILISPSEMKWVYGKFSTGQLQQIIESNYKKFTQNQFQVWGQSLRSIHRRYRQRWIDMDVELPQESYLYSTLRLAVESPVSYEDPDKVELLRDNELRMSRIQQQFQTQSPGSLNHSFVDKQLGKHYVQKNLGRPKMSITARSEQIEHSRIRTPIKQFQQLSSRSKSRRISQTEFREEDPFKIQLTKVPFDSDREQQPEKIQRKSRVQKKIQKKSRVQNSPPLEQPILRSPKEKYSPSNAPDDYGYRSRYRFSNNYIDSVYNESYLEQLVKQRERIDRIENDELDYIRLRRGLVSSPVHRNYYSTPTKHQNNYPQRYVGKLTNKRNFNYGQSPSRDFTQKYPTTSKYIPNLNTASNLDDDPKTNTRSKSPKKTQKDKTFDDSEYASSPKESEQGHRNFIKNNYQYWNRN